MKEVGRIIQKILAFHWSVICLLTFGTADAATPSFFGPWNIKIQQNGAIATTTTWNDVGTGAPKLSREFQGYISYKTTFRAPTLSENEQPGIYLGQVGDVDKVYVNGRLIGQTGGFPPHYKPYLDLFREYIIPPALLNPKGNNELLVETYVEYVSLKGLDLYEVELGEHKALQRKKYIEECSWYLLKIGIPVLCLFISLVSMPWTSTKIQLRPSLLLFLIGVAYCIFGLGKSRIIFHFIEPLLAYKILTTSALFGLVFIFIYSLDLCHIRQRWPYALAIGIPTVFALRIYSGSSLYEASLYVKDWLYGSIPLLFVIASASLFLARDKSIWVRIGLACLTIVAVNDVLMNVRLINSVNLMDVGFPVFIITMLISQMASVKRGWVGLSKRESDLMWSSRFLKMATQVGHDIRGPLSTMEPAVDDLNTMVSVTSFPNQRKALDSIDAIRSGMERLSSRSAKLLAEYKAVIENSDVQQAPLPRLTLVDKVIVDVVNEVKATAPAHVQFEVSGFSNVPQAWGVIEVSEIQAAVSNILRNAVEALEEVSKDRARVQVSLVLDKKKIVLEIADQGVGIPSEVLSRVFDEGFTQGKKSGTGLGLSQAKRAIELNEGKISIESKLGQGTSAVIELPRESMPAWCKTNIRLAAKRPVYFVDDDSSVLTFWREKIDSLNEQVPIAYLSSFSALPKDELRNSILVLDQDFKNEQMTGLEWLKKLPLIPETYLCTAAYDDPMIQERVKALRLSMIPKPLLRSVEFTLSRSVF